MTIRIVTDSTCDLPPAEIARHHIAVVPLYINMDDESYLDGIDISRQEFYERLPSCTIFPKTAVPGIEMFVRTYRRLVAEGATQILSIHISPTLSAVINMAQQAAEQIEVPVTIIDSRQLSLGVGFTVLRAAELAEAGRSMDEIVALLEDQIPRTFVVAALETLEFLRRSGRVNGLVSGIGNLLSVKPLLKMQDGVATSERVRTEKRAFQRVIELVSELRPLENLALVHTNAGEKADALWQQARHLFPNISNPLSVDVTPVLGAHLGPGAVGFACVAAPIEG
jgi:DegV family protein with EDD domain